MGFQKVDMLRQEKGEYFFSDRSIGKSLPANVLSAWHALEKGPTKSSNTAECSSGKFQFTKKDNKKELRRSGCTDGPAYADFVQSLEEVREYAKSI